MGYYRVLPGLSVFASSSSQFYLVFTYFCHEGQDLPSILKADVLYRVFLPVSRDFDFVFPSLTRF